MGNFHNGGNRGSSFRGGGRSSFQKKSWGDDRPREMHKAICSECGKTCEVPFKPTGDKPVYCNDCFSSKRDDGGERRPRQDFGDRGPRKSFGGQSGYQSTPRQSVVPTNDEVKKQLAEISIKMDRLINAVEKLSGVAKPVVAVTKITPKTNLVLSSEPTKKAITKPTVKKTAVSKPKKKK